MQPWRHVWNLTNNLPWDGTGEGGFGVDPDGDGRINLAEYFHGRNPRVADAGDDVRVEPGEGFLSVLYRYNPAATDVAWKAVWKTNLATPGACSTNGVTDTQESGTGGQWFRAKVPVGGGETAKFLRVEIGE